MLSAQAAAGVSDVHAPGSAGESGSAASSSSVRDTPSALSSESSDNPTGAPVLDAAATRAFLLSNPDLLQPQVSAALPMSGLGDDLTAVKETIAKLRKKHRLDEQTLNSLLQAPCDRMLGAPRLAAVDVEDQPEAVTKRLDDLFTAAKAYFAFKTDVTEKEAKKLTINEKIERGVFLTLKQLKLWFEDHTTDKESVEKVVIQLEDVPRYLSKYADIRARYVLETKGTDAALGTFVCYFFSFRFYFVDIHPPTLLC